MPDFGVIFRVCVIICRCCLSVSVGGEELRILLVCPLMTLMEKIAAAEVSLPVTLTDRVVQVRRQRYRNVPSVFVNGFLFHLFLQESRL